MAEMNMRRKEKRKEENQQLLTLALNAQSGPLSSSPHQTPNRAQSPVFYIRSLPFKRAEGEGSFLEKKINTC